MYKNCDKLVVLDGVEYDYNERIGHVGIVCLQDFVSVKLLFPDKIDGCDTGWFSFDEVTPVVTPPVEQITTEALTMEKAVDFLTSLGYNVTLTK